MTCPIIGGFTVISLLTCATAAKSVYPGRTLSLKAPVEGGLDAEKLKAFSEYVGGRGCVIRHGYRFIYGEISVNVLVLSLLPNRFMLTFYSKHLRKVKFRV